MRLKTILNLIAKKYPTDYRHEINPVLFIYSDESGAIVKDAAKNRYANGNALFAFSDIEELVAHLKSK